MSSNVDTDMVKRALAATDFADTPTSRRWMRAALAAAAHSQHEADAARIAELTELCEAADYLINRMDAVSRGVRVRDLDEAWSRYVNARSALSKVKP